MNGPDMVTTLRAPAAYRCRMALVSTTFDPEILKNLALGVSGVSLLVALILLKVVRSIVGRIVSTVLLVAIAFAGWSQRTEIADCVDKVSAQAATGSVTCTFFGQDVTVKVPSVTN